MIPDNFKTLIDVLIQKTEKNEAIWSKTSREDEYKIDLGKGAITVDSWVDNESGQNLVDIAVFNENGDRIDALYFSTHDDVEYRYVLALHTLARRAYYKIDETFNNIFKEISKEGTIGTDSKGL